MSDGVRQPRLDPRLARRLAEKKTRLDAYRPLPVDTVRRLNDDLRVTLTYHSNAIEGNTLLLQETRLISDYTTAHLGWLVRKGRLEAVERGGRWYSTPGALARYHAEVDWKTGPAVPSFNADRRRVAACP